MDIWGCKGPWACYKRDSFSLRWQTMHTFTYAHVIDVLGLQQPRERPEMQPIPVSYPLELVHLDFLTIGGKADDNRNVNILIVTDHLTKYAQALV